MAPGTNEPTTADDFAKLGAADLRAFQADTAEKIKALQGTASLISTALRQRFEGTAKQKLADNSKTHGTTHFDAGEGHQATAVIDQTVEWDSDKLMAVAAGMSWADVLVMFKIKFGMSEANFKALLPSDPRTALIKAARTVKYGDAKITLKAVA